MTRQTNEKILAMQNSKTLLKMGSEIWIANIYSLPRDVSSLIIPKDQLELQHLKLNQLKKRRNKMMNKDSDRGTMFGLKKCLRIKKQKKQ